MNNKIFLKHYIVTLLLLLTAGVGKTSAQTYDGTITKTTNADGSYTLTANVDPSAYTIYWFSMDVAAGMEPGCKMDEGLHYFGKYWRNRQMYLISDTCLTNSDYMITLESDNQSIKVTTDMFATYGKAFRYQAIPTSGTGQKLSNYISFGNVYYVNPATGKDNNTGLTISAPLKTTKKAMQLMNTQYAAEKTSTGSNEQTTHNAGVGTMNSNIIVLMNTNGSSADDLSGFSSTKAQETPYTSYSTHQSPITITGRYADYVGNRGLTKQNANAWVHFHNDLRLENLIFNGRGDFYNYSGSIIVMGTGLIMKGFTDAANMSSLGTQAADHCPFCIFSGKRSFPMTLNDQANSTYAKTSFPTGGENYFYSGYWARIIAGARCDDPAICDKANWHITGLPDHPQENRMIIDIDNSFYTDSELNATITTGATPAFDIGLLSSGQSYASTFLFSSVDLINGSVNTYINGSVGYNYAGSHGNRPVDSTWGRVVFNMKGGTVNYLYGGNQGRTGGYTSNGNFNSSFSRQFFYGESILNISGGTVNSAIYSGGCGGTAGLGNDTYHTCDDAIPYNVANSATSGTGVGCPISFGTYKQYKASGASMPTMYSRYAFPDEITESNPLNLETTRDIVNISGDAVIKGNIYGGGFGYSTYLENGNYTFATYLAGCMFGDTEVNITGGTINGTIYGGGGGTDKYTVTQNHGIDRTSDGDTTIPSTAAAFFNHDALGRVFGDTHVNISGSPVINGDIYAGAAGINSKSTYRKTTNAEYSHDANPYKEMAMVIGNTNLSITGTPTIYGNIYGGGQAASVTGNTNISIEGGTITGQVFGGGQGIDENHINTSTNTYVVAANVGGGSNVSITGGTFSNNIFGSGNYFGNQSGIANVNINGASVSITGNVYGGGNIASYTPTDATTLTPNVNLQTGKVTGSLYGGGLGTTAIVTANPQVTMSGGTVTQNVFGGGDAAKVDGNTSVTITGTDTKVGNNVYGGGNAADVTGKTNVQIGSKSN